MKHRGQYAKTLHGGVKYKLLEAGIGKRRHIPTKQRCRLCFGLGLDTDKLRTLSLLPQFYQCVRCKGTGRR